MAFMLTGFLQGVSGMCPMLPFRSKFGSFMMSLLFFEIKPVDIKAAGRGLASL
jgi:hypothetical protein